MLLCTVGMSKHMGDKWYTYFISVGNYVLVCDWVKIHIFKCDDRDIFNSFQKSRRHIKIDENNQESIYSQEKYFLSFILTSLLVSRFVRLKKKMYAEGFVTNHQYY